jgi:DUF1009 family protein
MHNDDLPTIKRLGLIAGNGVLPGLVLEEALSRQIPVTVAAIKEETDVDLDLISRIPGAPDVSIHWVGLGQLGKLIRNFKKEGVDAAVMVGQVKHVRIFAPGSRSPFSQIKHLPDLQMLGVLASLRKKDTGSLIGAVIDKFESEGVRFLDSTLFLRPYLASSGLMTARKPTREERLDFEYGRRIALEIARLDLGQTVVVKDQAVVAVEAMEGTDETIRRASELVRGEKLTVVKVSRPNQEMRFDVPVIGMRTLNVLRDCSVSALGVDAGKTLMVDKGQFLQRAGESGISVVGFE